jgi:alkanesulfonate monooxygenase SsuD/methylene tetrahydromethanopterin reductase-like flavin-dependent oxidoreductase (luciferase family)
VQISMTLPSSVAHTRRQFIDWCRLVDEGPWSSLAVPERVTYVTHDITVELAGAAALTERVKLWSTIVILPAHDAVAVAKQMASIDVLSDGRLTVGVGVGGREHDYRAVSAPYDRRWQRMDDQVAIMRSIWAQNPPFEGADPVGPAPVQPGGPRLIAGVMGSKAINRAAQWADGVDGAWTMDGDLDAMRKAFDQIKAAWQTANRTAPPHLSTSIWYALGPDAEQRLRTYAYDYMKIFGEGLGQWAKNAVTAFTPDGVRAAIDNARAAGADEFFLVPTTADPGELERTRVALGI